MPRHLKNVIKLENGLENFDIDMKRMNDFDRTLENPYQGVKAAVCKNQTKLKRMFQDEFKNEEFNNSIQVQQDMSLLNDKYYDYI